MVKLTREIMQEICNNLMIDLSEQEIEIITKLIENSVNKINTIKNLDFSDVKPMHYPTIKFEGEFRKDEPQEFDNKKALLELAGEIEDGYIKV
ncbi:MAG: hypothetical protein HUJ42_01890 [Malacoplasma sp.]|nr:hypothetical protein [Malacoplasma sp.]